MWPHLGTHGRCDTVLRRANATAPRRPTHAQITRPDVLAEAEKTAKDLKAALDITSDHGKQQEQSIDMYLRVMKNVIKDGAVRL